MKIGIPKALFYFRYGKFWCEFFKNLDFEVLISPNTNQQILNMGVKMMPSEVCLPVKIVAGHIEWLKTKVDSIFFPTIIEMNNGLYTCPKMIGIVDIVRIHVTTQCQILSVRIKNNFILSHFLLGLKFIPNPLKVYNALKKALPYLNNNKLIPAKADSNKPKILLLSHFYNLFDDFIGQDIISTFLNKGFYLTTKENLTNKILNSNQGFAKKIRWVYERELYNAFRYNVNKVNGICNIISFGCGPDSLISEIMMQEANEKKVPFIQLIIDEHTSKTGLVTRIEAFSDIVKRHHQSILC